MITTPLFVILGMSVNVTLELLLPVNGVSGATSRRTAPVALLALDAWSFQQSSFICNNQEVDIPLWGAALFLFISPVSWGIESELASVKSELASVNCCDCLHCLV